MKKKKNKKWLALLVILALVAILILLINSVKNNGDNAKLNLSEKKWIENMLINPMYQNI